MVEFAYETVLPYVPHMIEQRDNVFSIQDATNLYLPCSRSNTQVISHCRYGHNCFPLLLPPQVDSVNPVKSLSKQKICQTESVCPENENCIQMYCRSLHFAMLHLLAATQDTQWSIYIDVCVSYHLSTALRLPA